MSLRSEEGKIKLKGKIGCQFELTSSGMDLFKNLIFDIEVGVIRLWPNSPASLTDP